MSEPMTPERWHAIPAVRRELIVKAFASRMPDDPPDVLFHYTAPDAFVSILETRAIWVTNAAYLNDQGELAYPVQVARDVIDNEVRGASDRDIKALLTALADNLSSHVQYKDWYVASFTTEGNLLSQWRAYCARGGYSLGLYGPRLVSILLRHGAFSLHPVLYESQAQRQAVRNVVQKYVGMWPALRQKYSDMTATNLAVEVASVVAFVLAEDFVTFKSPAFAEEREWRITRYFDGDDQLRFRDRQGLLTPYITLDLADEDGKLPLSHIYMSPLVDSELGLHAASLLLNQQNYQGASELIKAPEYRLRF